MQPGTWPLLTAFAVAFLMTPVARVLGTRLNLLDVPNERSSHRIPIPRSGGYAILAGIVCGFLFFGSLDRPVGAILVGGGIVVLMGAVDDAVNLRQWQKFLAQVLAALTPMVGASLLIQSIEFPLLGIVAFGWLAPLVTGFWIVGYTNAFNFMDGINGIASAHAVVVSLTLALLFSLESDTTGATLALAIAGASAGFLPWNLKPGSIFMGDVGSTPVGYCLAFLAVRYGEGGSSFLVAVLPMLPFVLDTGVTLARRIVTGERFLSAHRSHFYQRLNRLGWSQVSVSAVWTVLAAIAAILALEWVQLEHVTRLVALVALLVLHATLFAAIKVSELKKAESSERSDGRSG